MLPVTTHIGCVRLRVASLDRSLGFYHELLGLQRESAAQGRATLRANGGGHPLVELVEKPGALPQPVRAAGLYHTAFLLPHRSDLGHALRRLAEAQYPLQGGSDHAVSEALYLADPDGNGVEIYADRPRELWPRANGEIAMATLPLDVDSLLAESDADFAGGEWSGFPEGTKVGHIHLRVPSVEGARKLLVDVIGFDVISAKYPGAIFVSAGGYHHHVAANIWEGRSVPPLPSEAAGLIDFEIIAPDSSEIAAIAERARGAALQVDDVDNGIAIAHDGIRAQIIGD